MLDACLGHEVNQSLFLLVDLVGHRNRRRVRREAKLDVLIFILLGVSLNLLPGFNCLNEIGSAV